LLAIVRPRRSVEARREPLAPTALLDAAFLQQLESLSLAARGVVTGGLIGEHASRRKASSVEFADYRGYVPGDDFRLIDWNVYARLGELCLKLTQARENVTLHLLLDASRSMGWGEPAKFLFARRLAAALGVVALANYDSVVLTVLRDGTAQRYPLLRGKSGIHRLLGFLTALEPGGATDLRQSMLAFCGARGHGGLAVLLSDLWDAAPPFEGQGSRGERKEDAEHVGSPSGDRGPLWGSEAPLGIPSRPTTGRAVPPSNDSARFHQGAEKSYVEDPRPGYEDALRYLLRAGWQPALVHILDPQEIEPQIEGALELIDCEDTARTLSVVVTPALLARYRAALAERMETLAAFCLGQRISYLPVRTTDSVESVVLDDLRRLAVVR
jgi:hypothetical protein